MYQIYENFIPKNYQDELETIFLKDPTPWYYNDATINGEPYYTDNNTIDTVQFTHVLHGYDGSYLNPVIYPMVYFFEDKTKLHVKEIERIKANLLLQNPNSHKGSYNIPHFDIYENSIKKYKSMIYYIHDSDGETIFFDSFYPDKPKKLKEIGRVKPQKGTAVVFPSHMYHASTNPEKSKKRTIINFVLEVEE